MAANAKEWQHVNAVDDHPAAQPLSFGAVARLPDWTRAKCRKCRRTIAVYPVGSGPESLRSLMRLR